ncbi:hypothetical protein [Enterocloster sp. OA13]
MRCDTRLAESIFQTQPSMMTGEK